jgi:Protein of unknown function (DUF3563)
MFALLQSLKNLFNVSAMPVQDHDDQYLAEACDIYDLERRMRQLDAGRQNLFPNGAHGIQTR